MSTNAVLLAAVMMTESGGRNITGDGGRAVGPLQVHAVAVADVNLAFGTHYTHADMGDRAKAAQVFDRYLWLYATPKRIGRAVTNEDRARIWNGGPDGWRRKATTGYWALVKRKMGGAR